MKNDLTLHKIAVLIDADNAQLIKLKAILDEISKYGRIIVKKAYGDWKNPVLKNWEDELKQLAIKPEQQFAYTKGKNATDIALVIDAMDLLYTNNHDAFVIVCSDADYTPLAIRLRETGAYIFGVGEERTPAAFRNSCDNFILTKNLSDLEAKTGKPKAADSGKAETAPAAKKEAPDTPSVKAKKSKAADILGITEVHRLLQLASDTYQDDDGWVNASSAGDYIKRARPDFDLKLFEVSRLSQLISKYPDFYETKKGKNGKSSVFSYRLK